MLLHGRSFNNYAVIIINRFEPVQILFLPKRMKLKIVLMLAQFAYTTNKYSRSLEKN